MSDPVPVSAISTVGTATVSAIGSNGSGGGKILSAAELRAAASLATTDTPEFAAIQQTGTGAMTLPSGTTAQRPTGAASMMRWNTTTSRHEFWTGAAWDNHFRLSGDTFAGPISGTNNTIDQRNGLNAQTYNLFETFTSTTNFGSLCLKATASGHQIGSARGTSGSNRAVQLGHFDAAGAFTPAISLATSGAVTFAAAIIGSLSGIGVPVGGNGFNFQGSGFFTCASSGVFTFQDGAATSFGRLQLGGTTSAYPSIKRNGTAINFRLANDSADCPITAAAITASGAITPATLTDAAAPNGSIYFSSTASRLVYKDAAGTVNNLY